MPIALTIQTITLLSGGGTSTLPTSTIVHKYRIRSIGSISLSGNQSFTTSGTLVAGVFYDFHWEADVDLNGNTVTFMGETMPEYLANKEFQCTAMYNGTAWEVKFFPSINETAVIPHDSFVVSPYCLIDTLYPTTTVESTNTTSKETFYTANIPASTLATDGDTLMIVAHGTTAANANVKTLRIEHVASGDVLATNVTSTAPNGKDWQMVVYIRRSGQFVANTVGATTMTAIATDIESDLSTTTYDWDGIEQFIFTSQCGTAAVGNIVLRGFEVFKLIQ